MDELFPTPEAAACEDDPDGVVTRVVAVAYSPDRTHALVFLEYSGWMPYEVLCEQEEGGWFTTIAGSGGGQGWKFTHEDPERGVLGVATAWDPPSARWDAEEPSWSPPPGEHEPW